MICRRLLEYGRLLFLNVRVPAKLNIEIEVAERQCLKTLQNRHKKYQQSRTQSLQSGTNHADFEKNCNAC